MILQGAGSALIVFLLALLLVTGMEVVIGNPLAGGQDGHTSLGDLLRPPPADRAPDAE